MRIYKMTATFGKLENQTLTLEPGLNVITAPNEWGKSTWCAFLMAMFYGLDTRAKSSKTTIADKERYVPWSGSPMAGSIDLQWKGRDITIQRQTSKRIPLGDFRAFETESGLPVPELTGENCGAMLLGVEQSVFRRAGFIRQTDMPVTQDEALRRRLNALVTTGEENGSAESLAESLKELKNRCRYNKTGLLPQAETRKAMLEEKLEELNSLEAQCRKLKMRLEELRSWQIQLRNHQQALSYAGAEANAGRVAKARDIRDQAEQQLRELEAACGKLPPREEAEAKLRDMKNFREQWSAMQIEQQALPDKPEIPQLCEPFAGKNLEESRMMVQQDAKAFRSAMGSKIPAVLMIVGMLGLVGAGGLLFLKVYIPGAIAAGAALAAICWGLYERSFCRRQAKMLAKKYGSIHPERWPVPLEEYEQRTKLYQEALKRYQDFAGDLDVRYLMLQKKREALCGGQEPEMVQEFWQQVLIQWDMLDDARREALREQSHFEMLSNLVKPVERPAMKDRMTCTEEETVQLLAESMTEQQRLQNRLGQHQGRMESLGDRENLQRELEECKRRITRLEDTYSALSIALETLADARAELQRRFAPRIARKAQSLMETMTGGRYHRLSMGADLSLQAAAGEEPVLRDLQWRSDGTMDQLYLALRLAVAEELTPKTPLVLDDALVRFDDTRMAAAVKILKDLAQNRQIILFTCQTRELEA